MKRRGETKDENFKGKTADINHDKRSTWSRIRLSPGGHSLRNLLAIVFIVCLFLTYLLGNILAGPSPFSFTPGYSLFASHESKHFIVMGQGISKWKCEGDDEKPNQEKKEDCQSQVADDGVTHALRCCSETKKETWENDKCKEVWATSFCKEVTWIEADAECRLKGARLCTKKEIEKGCTGSTGCNFDTKLIWTSEKATDGKHYVVPGIGIYGYVCTDETGDCSTRVVPNSETYGVRCCADTFVNGYNKEVCPGLWGVWTRNTKLQEQCITASWSAANAHCRQEGARLCTKTELENGCAKGGAGCNFDETMMWTSSIESGNDCSPYPHSLGYLSTVMTFNSNTWFGAYKTRGYNLNVIQVGSKFGAWTGGKHPLQTIVGFNVYIAIKLVEPALANFKDPIYVVDKEILPFTGRAVMDFIGWTRVDLLAVDSKGDADTLVSFFSVMQPNFVVIDMYRVEYSEIVLIESTFVKYGYDYIPKAIFILPKKETQTLALAVLMLINNESL